MEVEPVRGRRDPQVTMLAFIDLETRVPPDHPLRVIKKLADQSLEALSPDLDRMYADVGRPSIPPERLLKSSLLIALFSVRSERAFCEQLDYNLLFRWFLGMNPIEPSFDATTFTKNRERLLKHGVGQALFDEVVLEADRQGLLSDEHFTVDGTLIEAAASLKSFKPRAPRRPTLTRAIPRWTSMGNGEAMPLTRAPPTRRPGCCARGKVRLVFMAHALMENRNGMLVDFQTTQDGDGGAGYGTGAGGPSQEAGLSSQNDGWRQGLRHRRLRVRPPSARGHASCGAEHQGTVQRH